MKMQVSFLDHDFRAVDGTWVEVPRKDARLCRTGEAQDALRWAMRKPGRLVHITFSGYGDDPREIWDIEECRQYMSQLRKTFPKLLSLLTDDTVLIASRCLATGVKTIPGLMPGFVRVAIPDTPENAEYCMATARISRENGTLI